MILPVNVDSEKGYPLLLLILTAFLCAGLLRAMKVNMANENTINDKTHRVLSCGPGNFIWDKQVFDDRQPTRNNKDNGCPHHWGSSGCLCMPDSKRRKNYSG